MSLIPAPVAGLPWRIMALTTALACFAGIVLYSAAGGSMTPWAGMHLVRFAVFLVMALVISRLDEDFIKAMSIPAYAGVALLLLFVEVVGQVKGGSQRWISLGGFNLQPSELMKIAIVLALARFYAMLPAGETTRFAAIWPALVLIGIPSALVLLQPDLGTTLAIVASGVIVMFIAGLPLRYFLGAAGAATAAAPILFSMLHDYQQKRILIFLTPEADPLGSGYHIVQSKIAIGSGGLFGKGFLNGTQSHLQYLPEGHTDFVFATMAEEWGLFGGLMLLFGFFLLLRWATGVALRAQTKFGRYTAAGLTMTIFFYVAINLMMVMGLAPVVGIPLPFMSYGGSSMMTIMICIGIILSIDRKARRGRIGLS